MLAGWEDHLTHTTATTTTTTKSHNRETPLSPLRAICCRFGGAGRQAVVSVSGGGGGVVMHPFLSCSRCHRGAASISPQRRQEDRGRRWRWRFLLLPLPLPRRPLRLAVGGALPVTLIRGGGIYISRIIAPGRLCFKGATCYNLLSSPPAV